MKSLKSISAILTFIFVIHLQATAQQTKLTYRLEKLVHSESDPQKSIAVLIKGNVTYLREEIQRIGGHVKYTAGNIIAANLPVQALIMISNDPNVQRIEEGNIKLQTMNDRMLINNKVDKVHQGISPLTQGYDGNGVIVGVIDTGIDFTHPDFIDSLGRSRVLWIWDHYLPVNASTPAAYGYGEEFSNADIMAGNATAHVDAAAHGTHVTGIATSNGRSHTEYTGVASKADIIAVSLDFGKDDDVWLSSVADAVNYIYAKADSAGKPCSINISAGTYYGSHDGQDLSTQAMDFMVSQKPGRSIAAAAGNEGDNAFHLQHNLSNDTLFTWFHQTTPDGIYIEMWADTADLNNVQFTIGADNITPTFVNRGQLFWTDIAANLGTLRTDTLKSISGNRLATVQRYGQRVGKTYSMIYYVVPDSSTYYFRLMTKGTGKLDIWSFEMINSNLPAPSIYPEITKYVSPDLHQTMCSAFQCSDKVITVGQYVNRNNYIDSNGNLQTFPMTEGNLAETSSQGPTRDGRIKPDITSTGEYTMSALSLVRLQFFLANQPYKLAADSIHIRDGGTSSASPVVAGVAALYFQKNPTATCSDYKTHVLACAMQDNFTGVTPNNAYGYGKLDAFAVMTGCAALGVDEITETNFIAYPNPASNLINVYLPEHNQELHLEIYNILGKKIRTVLVPAGQQKTEITKGNLSSGLYLVSLKTGAKTLTQRIVFE